MEEKQHYEFVLKLNTFLERVVSVLSVFQRKTSQPYNMNGYLFQNQIIPEVKKLIESNNISYKKLTELEILFSKYLVEIITIVHT